jgi:hypothetical protein
MNDEEEKVDAGSETSGETTETVETETVVKDAGEAAEPKAGDPCTCPDGRDGTLNDQDGTLVCLPNQG